MEWSFSWVAANGIGYYIHARSESAAADVASGSHGITVDVAQSLVGYYLRATFGLSDLPADLSAVMAEGLAAAKAWEAANPLPADAEREV